MTDSATPNSTRSVKRHVIGLAILFTIMFSIVAILYKGLNIDTSQVPSALLNKPALEFDVVTISGQNQLPTKSETHFNLEDFKGKPLILNFWASWCFSCRQEAHYLEQFWQKYGDQVAIVGIAIQDTKEAALGFIKQFGKTYLIGLDTTGKASLNYGVSGVPETFFIDPEGVIRHKEAGPVTVELMKKYLPLISGSEKQAG